jgi:3-oxocholest-4-en-26-oyl-CoA dehydrogenase beta subunit
MDFTLDDEQQALRDLAAQIGNDFSSPEKLKEQEAGDDPVDRRLWAQLGESGLLGLVVPEQYGGGGRGFLDAALVAVELGRRAARVPYTAHVAAAMTIARSDNALALEVLADLASGERIATVAPDAPDVTVGSDGRLSGVVANVVAGTVADVVVIASGGGVYLVDLPGPAIERQDTIAGIAEGRIHLDATPAAKLGGADLAAHLRDVATAGMCLTAWGVCEEAVRLTAEYTKTRKQFDRPIASFQAVGQRAADAYIDTQGVRLTALQAAWRIDAGLPASREVQIAKFWVADGGQRVVHAAQHLHGGMGVDRDYPLHRYFLMAKQIELNLGGGTSQLLALGKAIAAS